METATEFIGRALETDQTLNAIKKGNNILIKGKEGIGKSEFLNHVSSKLRDNDKPIIMVTTGSAKQVMDDLAKQLHEAIGLRIPVEALGKRQAAKAGIGLTWQQLQRTIKRMAVKDVLTIVEKTLEKADCLIFIESLEVAPTLADAFATIIERAQVVAAIDEKNRRTRIKKLLWQFQITIELKPLTLDESEQLAILVQKKHQIRFDSQETQKRFTRHIARVSGGIPTAIHTMIEGAAQEEHITPAKIRTISHDAGTTYFDMTPLLIIALMFLMALRYVGKGIDEAEMMIISGVGMALFMGLRMLMYSIRR